LGLLLEQGNQGTHRNVALDNITADQCSVTRDRFVRNINICFECREVLLFPLVDFRSVLLQVPDPLCATSSAGRFVNLDAHSDEIAHSRRRTRRCRLKSATGAPDNEKNEQ